LGNRELESITLSNQLERRERESKLIKQFEESKTETNRNFLGRLSDRERKRQEK